MKFKIFFFILLSLSNFASHNQGDNFPYPYKSTEPNKANIQENIILLGSIGPALANNLKNSLHKYLGYTDNLKIKDLSNEKQSIHQSYDLLINKINIENKIIIFFLGDQFQFNLFPLNQAKLINQNIALYENKNLNLILNLIPYSFSKYIYKSFETKNLPEEFDDILTDFELENLLMIQEVYFKLFNYKLKSLLKNIYQNNSKIIFITNPVNLAKKIHKDCPVELINIANKYALNYQKYYKGNYSREFAFNNLESSRSFHCNFNAQSAIFNQMAKFNLTQYSIPFIDWNKLIVDKYLLSNKEDLVENSDWNQYIAYSFKYLKKRISNLMIKSIKQ